MKEDSLILDIKGLVKRYGRFEALAGIDLEVAHGEFIALLGPSGCGKSTTLMAIAGFVQPDNGNILLSGREITKLPPERRGMGVVFQDYALFPHLSVLENVAFPLRMRGIGRREREEKAASVLEQVQLPAKSVHSFPNELSGGQRQRVAVARALVFDPVMLLMDEPLAALDRRLRQHLQFELRHLQRRLGTTVIYVTHDQEEALVLADRIAVMRDGRFEQVDAPRMIYDRPANAFVAGFLGESNRLSGTVKQREDGRQTFVAQGLDFECPVLGESSGRFLVVRPERIRLVAERPAEQPSMPAVISDVAFLGDKLRVEVTLADGSLWTASIPAANLPENDTLIASGNSIFVTWCERDARLLTEEVS